MELFISFKITHSKSRNIIGKAMNNQTHFPAKSIEYKMWEKFFNSIYSFIIFVYCVTLKTKCCIMAIQAKILLLIIIYSTSKTWHTMGLYWMFCMRHLNSLLYCVAVFFGWDLRYSQCMFFQHIWDFHSTVSIHRRSFQWQCRFPWCNGFQRKSVCFVLLLIKNTQANPLWGGLTHASFENYNLNVCKKWSTLHAFRAK